MCPPFVSNSSSLPNSTSTPLFFFFSLLLSSGCLDYVAKEIFFFFLFCFFSLFPIDLVLMRFECPLVCAEHWGKEGCAGSCRVEEFKSEAFRWGSVWVKAQREALKWELKWFAELRNLSGSRSPFFPHLFIQGHSFIGSPQVHCQSPLFISKT